MDITALKELNKFYIHHISTWFAQDPWNLREHIAIARGRNGSDMPDYELIERIGPLPDPYSASKYVFICADESDMLEDLVYPNPKTHDFFRAIKAKIKNNDFLRADNSLIEVYLNSMDCKIGLNICGYTSDTLGEYGLINDPLTISMEENLTQLAFLYAISQDSKVDDSKHKKLLKAHQECDWIPL